MNDMDNIIISEAQLQSRVAELGRQLEDDYSGKEPICIGILKGAIMFIADLIRATNIPLQVDFMAVSSYGSNTRSSGIVRILKDLEDNIKDRHVILVEDILDTGLTLNYLLKNLRSRQPASLEICALLVKDAKKGMDLKPKYTGFVIPDNFIVGYGLDYNEKYRNLPYIGILKPGIIDE